MKRRTVETSVGVFVFLGLLCVAYLTVRLGRMQLVGGDVYPLQARFASVSGLKPGASVQVAGVEVGQVGHIRLDPVDAVAVVTLKLHSGIEVPDDTIASVKTSGLIGDRYISLQLGGSETILKPGEAILETESAVDLEGIISKFAHGGI